MNDESEAADLRELARRCDRVAELSHDPEITRQLRAMARELRARAEQIDGRK